MKSLIESIQKNLGYQPITKMDPNTQDIKTRENQAGIRSLAQAAIPSMACGLLDKLQSPEDAHKILHGDDINWVDMVFGQKAKEFIKRMANYAGTSLDYTRQECVHIANEAVRLIREAVGTVRDQATVHSYAAAQKNETLFYLPEALHLGDLINNNPLDDRTHKMQGPVSSLMHSIENKFN